MEENQNQYNFPENISLEEAREAVQGHPGFCCYTGSDHIIIDYKLAPSTVADYTNVPRLDASDETLDENLTEDDRRWCLRLPLAQSSASTPSHARSTGENNVSV